MKKFLLTSALILALVVSITAGTMAAYTLKVATITGGATTKKFAFETVPAETKGFVKTHRIAPGDKIVETVTLTNNGEVSADIDVVAKLLGNGIGMEGMTILVEKTAGGGAGEWTNGEAGSSSNATTGKLLPEKSVEYTVTVAWEYGEGRNDYQNKDKNFGFEVVINATSVDEKNEYNGVSET